MQSVIKIDFILINQGFTIGKHIKTFKFTINVVAFYK